MMMRHTYSLGIIALMLLAPISLFATDYRVGPTDVLSITVYENDDMETLTRVEEDGTIKLPLLDQVEVAGMTVVEISKHIEGLLADGYLVDPHVSVFVTEFKSQKVVVMGQVKNPGLYELTEKFTVIEVISRAGGFTDIAAQNSLKIIRKHDDGEKMINDIDYSDMVMPDDVIVVPESLF